MGKKIAVINDLSGFGRCSLTAAISVISVMGVQPCPLPTAVLSAQTGYPSYYCDDYTEKMEFFRREWEKMGAAFDGIYTGFVANEAQIGQIFRFLDSFHRKGTFLLVDPVMGDDGRVYAMFTPGLLKEMKTLAVKADIITPNLTELCMLADEDFEDIRKAADTGSLMKKIEKLGRHMLARGPEMVVVTGIHFLDETDRTRKIGNMLVTKEGCRVSAFPYIGGSFSGTGDLFASVIAGGMARGDDLFDTMELAGAFIERAMEDSVKEGVERNDGVNYEKYLGMLSK
ncbi:MAG: pyridoxamine kinase [Schaedlerella sp.]|nr:pyridoxamine kinase [Lachnospiraceae bacterium]MDY4202535.1 pyridoxamine kinase [Schaedlerella sp.]